MEGRVVVVEDVGKQDMRWQRGPENLATAAGTKGLVPSRTSPRDKQAYTSLYVERVSHAIAAY